MAEYIYQDSKILAPAHTSQEKELNVLKTKEYRRSYCSNIYAVFCGLLRRQGQNHIVPTRGSKEATKESDIFTLTCNYFPSFLMAPFYIICQELLLLPKSLKTANV